MALETSLPVSIYWPTTHFLSSVRGWCTCGWSCALLLHHFLDDEESWLLLKCQVFSGVLREGLTSPVSISPVAVQSWAWCMGKPQHVVGRATGEGLGPHVCSGSCFSPAAWE